MRKETTVLEYASPPASLARRCVQQLRTWARAIRWFCFERPLDALEVAIGAGVVGAAAYAYFGAIRFQVTSNALRPFVAVSAAMVLTAAVAVGRLLVRRRWRALLVVCAVAAPVSALSGMVQTERCPHAAYVQVLGISIPVAGDPCGNPRKTEPWWMRD